ncbi:unnamed protein product [Paramecium octaurelia]|uniref:Uncharacterized protein n=1 Tax=Paramecium octaurelia TaxID=43137 RepID=A0A8S1YQR5_PAROT|nr:unnamed protein product [Paramecium octaurelia]
MMRRLYFVQYITLLDKFFLSALGGLKLVLVAKLSIKSQLKSTQNLKWLVFFQDSLQYLDQSRKLMKKNDFVFELELPNCAIQDNERNAQIKQAQLEITDPFSKRTLQIQF